MPARVIRNGLIDSEIIAALHDRTFRLYVHLLLSADDYGLVEIDFGPVRRAAPLLDWNRELVAKMLGELVDAALILPYEVEGKRYAAIARWRSWVNSTKPKHPTPAFGMAHVLQPYYFKSQSVREAASKFLSHLKELGLKSPPPVPPQGGAGSPLVVEGVRGKGVKIKPAEPDGSLDPVWGPGLQTLITAGIREDQARSFVGALLGSWTAADVLEALQASSGAADPRGYARGVLKDKPKKGEPARQNLSAAKRIVT
jgi:hypothetical protein